MYQFETGKISFNKTTGGPGVLYDLQDEVEAYERQYIIKIGKQYGTVDLDRILLPNYQITNEVVIAIGLQAGIPYHLIPATQITIDTNPEGTALQAAGQNATDIFVKP
jgi:hypothetical protein